MKNTPRVSLLMASLALAIFSTNAFCDPPRQRILMDAGWRFHRGEIPGVTLEGPTKDPSYIPPLPAAPRYDDSSWSAVHLPHDYVIEGPFEAKGDPSHGSIVPTTGWYRKVFKLPAGSKGKSLWIDFDGVYRDSIVWLNGKHLGRHPSGYTSFRYDITEVVDFGGENVLTVHVDPTRFEGWWYEGGGIYRHVWLNIADRVHAAPWGTFVTAQLPEPVPEVPPASANISVSTVIANTGTEESLITLVSEVIDRDAKTVASAVSSKTVAPGQSETFLQKAVVAQPRLWSLRTPYLYDLVTTVKQAERVLDVTRTPFGIRTIRFDIEKGFFLNGEHVKIQGVCNHQDFAGVGVAVPDTLQAWRVKRMKEMGANAWRMAHNPPNPELLDACDQLGMLVMDENRKLGDSAEIQSQVAEMVLRDRNHPSIILWSMCNEEPRQGTPEGAKQFSTLREVVLKHDRTRPVTSAMNGGMYERISLAKVGDMVGGNYCDDEYGALHKAHPAKPLFASETASTVTTRGEYADDKQRTVVTSYNMTDRSWAPVAERAFVAGSFVWTGFDYKGEPTPYKWPCIGSHFGVMDSCGFPKDNYYYYQSWWKADPIVHILPHWNWQGKEGQEIKVLVFSNCEKVELFLNGQSLGSRPMRRNSHLEWKVKYSVGILEAKGINKGQLAAADKVETTGAPAALRLKTDRLVLTADGEDLSVVEVDVVDREGRIIPTAGNRVSFSIEGAGRIAGVGNGDPGDHDPDKGVNRRAFNGKCMVLVAAVDRSGPIVLRAAADGLMPAVMNLNAAQ
ncbi:MAG: beta-galactosidase GalA [Planctomycetota bacterium]